MPDVGSRQSFLAPPDRARKPPVSGVQWCLCVSFFSEEKGRLSSFLAEAYSLMSDKSVSKACPTVEQLVVRALIPELRKWLNAHLSGVVARVIRQEMQRTIPRMKK